MAALVDPGGDPTTVLARVVRVIASRFGSEVCSAYLLEPDRANLILAATIGLQQASVGRVRLGLHEGLVGLVAEQVGPVAVEYAQSHPRFKRFRETGEDEFQSFLGVPLVDDGVLQGALVVQTQAPRRFSPDEVDALVAAALQVTPIITAARVLHRFVAPTQDRLWTLARN